MKKLTAGIFAGILAIVTVNAARADIATTNYVNQNVDAKVGTLGALTTSAKGNTVAAINEVNQAAKDASTAAGKALTDAKTYADGLNTAMDTRVDATESAIAILNGDATTEGSVANKITQSTMTTVSELNTVIDKVEKLQGNAEVVGSVDNKIKTEIGKLDGKVTGSGVVKTISQTDGVLTATLSKVAKADLDNALTTEIDGKMAETDYTTATTMAADGTYAKKTNTVGVNLTELDKGIVAAKAAADSASTAAGTALTDAKAYTDARETAITTAYKAYADTAEADAVATSKGYADELNTAMNARVTANTNSITTLNGADTVEGSVKKQIKDAIATVNTAANTLAGRVTANENAISTLKGTGEGSVAKALSDAKGYADGLNTAMDTRVTANTNSITNITKAGGTIDTKITAAQQTLQGNIDGKANVNKDLANKLLTTDATTGQLKEATAANKPSDCGTNGVTCMLVNDGSGFKWEKIVDTYAAK